MPMLFDSTRPVTPDTVSSSWDSSQKEYGISNSEKLQHYLISGPQTHLVRVFLSWQFLRKSELKTRFLVQPQGENFCLLNLLRTKMKRKMYTEEQVEFALRHSDSVK